VPKFSLDEPKEAFEVYDKVRIWEIRSSEQVEMKDR